MFYFKNSPISLLGSSIFIRKTQVDAISNEEPDKDMLLKRVKRLNLCGKIVFAIVGIMFNGIFWAVAFTEYFRPAEKYITDP